MIQYILMFLLLFVALFLILVVLIQRGRGGGLAGAFGGLGGQSAFGTKAGDLFTRVTIVVAAVWIILCIATVKYLSSSGDILRNVGQRAPAMPPAGGGTAQPAGATAPSPAGGGQPAEQAPATPAPASPAGEQPASSAPPGAAPAEGGSPAAPAEAPNP